LHEGAIESDHHRSKKRHEEADIDDQEKDHKTNAKHFSELGVLEHVKAKLAK
jgi:hypothetical protein